MANIYQLPMQVPGMVGVQPNQKFMVCGDNLAAVTTAGYLNQVNLESNPVSNTDILQVLYSFNPQTTVGTYGVFTVSISGTGTITLAQADLTGGVTLPTVVDHIIVSTNTTGQLANLTGTAINDGSIQAGLSGTAGSLISYPATASKGSLAVTAVANTGNTVTTLSNDAMGQTTVVNIPDPGNAVGQLLVGATSTPFVSGNFPQNSGTAGLMVDSGLPVADVVSKIAANTFTGVGSIILPKVNGTEATNAVTADGVAGLITTSSLTTAGGASYAITWTNTVMTATSVVLLTVAGGTNTTENITLKIVPGAGSGTLTIYNNTAATALNGTILISYLVI
jgi:hypothetical protein